MPVPRQPGDWRPSVSSEEAYAKSATWLSYSQSTTSNRLWERTGKSLSLKREPAMCRGEALTAA